MTQPVFGTMVRFSTDGRGTTAKSMTAITTVENPVVTASAHSLKDGDVIEISGSSYKDLNRMHTIAVVDENSFILAGFDLSKSQAILIPGSFKTVTMMQFCDVTGFDFNEFEVSSETKNTVCRKAKTFTVEMGGISLDFVSDDADALQKHLRESGKKLKPIIMQFQREGSNQLRGYLAQVTNFNETGEADGDWEGSMDTELLSFSQDVEISE
ncbi:hypothetical protein ADP71_31780 [Vitreoscilla sp. C1]|uniref:hypothetical protein n=1 Tax=Vitreoscilla sp. (strain C1) TaxID=96942 RepID=UPI000CDC2936|nr:hypothetical protein [Vitreoscilla sp. C1]AUZ06356.1 hypothetical protein ADP71_31780 [Vitreoscilla sp. C1]